MLKRAAIYSIWEQPDSAAEILLTFRHQIPRLIDVDAASTCSPSRCWTTQTSSFPTETTWSYLLPTLPQFILPPHTGTALARGMGFAHGPSLHRPCPKGSQVAPRPSSVEEDPPPVNNGKRQSLAAPQAANSECDVEVGTLLQPTSEEP